MKLSGPECGHSHALTTQDVGVDHAFVKCPRNKTHPPQNCHLHVCCHLHLRHFIAETCLADNSPDYIRNTGTGDHNGKRCVISTTRIYNFAIRRLNGEFSMVIVLERYSYLETLVDGVVAMTLAVYLPALVTVNESAIMCMWYLLNTDFPVQPRVLLLCSPAT